MKLPIKSNAQGHIEYVPNNPVPVAPGQVVGLFIRSRISPLSYVDAYFLEIPFQNRYYFTETESSETVYNAEHGPNGNRYVPQLSVELCKSYKIAIDVYLLHYFHIRLPRNSLQYFKCFIHKYSSSSNDY